MVAARRERRRLERLPETYRPADDATGYAIQRRVMTALCGGSDDGVGGDGVGGWKIGAGGPDETPLYAPILADEIHASGATLAAADFPDALVEAEIAFRLRHDLPPRGDAYDLATVAAAVEMLPALEIYRSRYRDPGAVTQSENLADCLANAGLVVGDPSAGSAQDPAPSWDIDLGIDGGIREGRVLRHPVGDPRRLVVWLANELIARGEMLRAGQVVTTGALVLGPLGRDIRGEWRGIGAVSVRFG
ncbi:MAG: 2-keto-4-pentenoate hydratase [Gammaproteobacteria bacterium]